MERMGDKARAKRELRAADVPLIPGTEGATTLAEAGAAAAELGFPVLLKASAGGGGKGMRLVAGPDELENAFHNASAEAQAAFGDGSLYLEKAVVPARHVEIQVLCDSQGDVLTLGERGDPISALKQGFLDVRQRIGTPDIVLGCDCILRRLEFEHTGHDAAVGEFLAQNRVVGFSTYGEQYNAIYVNQTFSAVALSST